MGKHSAQFERGPSRNVRISLFQLPKRLVTNTRRWNCAGHPLFCDSALTGRERMLRPSCFVRHPTPCFIPPPRLTQSFSRFHPSVTPSSLRLLSNLAPPPLASYPPTHSPTQSPAHTPPNTIPPFPLHANEPRTVHGCGSRNSTHGAWQTGCVRASVAAISSP